MSAKSRYIPSKQPHFAWHDCPQTLGKYKRKVKKARKVSNRARAMQRRRRK